jgi:uncharacterized RDD family membrane protein YckC
VRFGVGEPWAFAYDRSFIRGALSIMPTILRVPSITGIDIELAVAGPGGRSYAFVVDWHIRVLAAAAWFFAGTFALAGALRALQPGDQGYAAFIYGVLLPSGAIYFLYHPVLEVVLRGQTPGKRTAGVRLVALADGGAPSIGALLIRNVFRLVDALPVLYALGLLMTLATKNATRIGDIAAGTVLVYDESRGPRLRDPLQGSAVQRLGLASAELLQDLLQRWPELAPDSRARLARELLGKAGVDLSQTTDDGLEAALRELLR